MPGFVLTDHNQQRVPDQYKEQIRSMLPTRSLPTPQDIASVILFLGSPVNRQITGEVIRVTGGAAQLSPAGDTNMSTTSQTASSRLILRPHPQNPASLRNLQFRPPKPGASVAVA